MLGCQQGYDGYDTTRPFLITTVMVMMMTMTTTTMMAILTMAMMTMAMKTMAMIFAVTIPRIKCETVQDCQTHPGTTTKTMIMTIVNIKIASG